MLGPVVPFESLPPSSPFSSSPPSSSFSSSSSPFHNILRVTHGRYYRNNFADGPRQDAIDLLLGNHTVNGGEGVSTPSPFARRGMCVQVVPLPACASCLRLRLRYACQRGLGGGF